MSAETVRLIGGVLLSVTVTLVASGVIVTIGSIGHLMTEGTFIDAGILAGLTAAFLIGLGWTFSSSI